MQVFAGSSFVRISLAALALSAAAAPLPAQQAAPQPADSVNLSLQEALNRALTVGDEVRLAERRSDAAKAQLGVARAAQLPRLTTSGAYTHVYESARAQAVGAIFNQPNTYSANANLNVPLYQGGRAAAGVRSASRTRGATEAELADTRQAATLDVLGAYLDALLAERLVRIQEANLALAEQQLAQAQQLERAGRQSRYDVLRARVQRANLEPALIQARADREAAALELKRLTNLPPMAPLRLTSSLQSAEVQALAASLAALAVDSAALDSLPAVRAAELRAEASRAQVTVARADYLPTLSVFLQSGYQAFPLSGLPTSFGRLNTVDCPPGSAADRVCTQQNGGWFTDRSAGLQVSWPVFDGFRTRSNVALARANADIAAAQARQAREAAAVQAANARNALLAAQAIFAASGQNVAEAEEAYRLAALRFSRGLGTQLEVQDAQLALLTARTNEARAVHGLYLATAEVARALGR
ncbi:MAG TPA: TolC family protein, partial [Longimicrobiaceae bacterium]